MYEAYWQFTRSPFDQHIDSRGCFRSDSHQACLLKLHYLVENQKGAGLLVGGTGVGKSALLQVLAHELDDSFRPFVHVTFPQLAPAELLAYLAVELGADPEAVGHEHGRLDCTIRQLERQFAEHNAHRRSPVLVIDEAHLIDDVQVFQTLQLLLNLQQKGADFSLILAGQRELLAKVRRIAPLDERLAVKCQLQSLNAEETTAYIQWRLELAGAREPIFSAEALEAVFEQSGGVPRRINHLCDMALLVGYADESATVSAAQVEAVCEEMLVAD